MTTQTPNFDQSLSLFFLVLCFEGLVSEMLRGKNGGKNVGRNYDLDSTLQGIDLSFRVALNFLQDRVLLSLFLRLHRFSWFIRLINQFLPQLVQAIVMGGGGGGGAGVFFVFFFFFL